MTAGGAAPLIREGSGAGHGIDVDLGQAHESALKEAETDAMKRALMTFGNPFGLALYDKQQREVSGGQTSTTPQRHYASAARSQGAPAESRPSSPQPPEPQARPALQRPGQPAAQPVVWHSSEQAISRAFNGPPRVNEQPVDTQPKTLASQPLGPDAPLEPSAIARLQERLSGLTPGHREVFSRAFCTAFQVPKATPTVAGLINQERHRSWIEEFLAKADGG